MTTEESPGQSTTAASAAATTEAAAEASTTEAAAEKIVTEEPEVLISPPKRKTTPAPLVVEEYPDYYYYYYEYYGDGSGGIYCHLRDQIGSRVDGMHRSLDSMLQSMSSRKRGSKRPDQEKWIRELEQVADSFVAVSSDILTKNV